MAYKETQESLEGSGREAAKLLGAQRTGLVLTGRIRNGKLELDETTLAEVAERYPTADISFVAMNSPFDPESQAV